MPRRQTLISVLALVLLTAAGALAQQSPHGALALQCETCHSTASWSMRRDGAFSHSSTGFALAGQHSTVECRTCHPTLVFSAAEPACTSCHADVHQNELGATCLRCHSNDSWIIRNIQQMHQQTRFPLAGRHQLAECSQCHPNSAVRRFAGMPVQCIGCHRDEYLATANPNHQEAGFSPQCEVCHTVSANRWPAGFDHARTGFSLTGAHRSTACTGCHAGNKFAGTPGDCYSCHTSDFTAAASPSHTANGFSHACLTCHSTAAWSPTTFNHDATNFPLAGAHRVATCGGCHTNGNYTISYTGCYSCHQSDFTLATNPSHRGFDQACLNCHTQTAWRPASFDHATTQFPLAGAHRAVACTDCHANGNYTLSYSGCIQCHQNEYAQAANPSHANFPQACLTCHSQTTWRPATFDHDATKFALAGAHRAAACADCHTNGNYTLSYTGCFQCHQDDFATATNPSHAGFDQACLNCHTQTAWSPASFDHAKTRLPLTGAHTSAGCTSCHVNGNYRLAYTDCYQCHQTDFARPTDPNHVSAGFGHDCTPCHSTTAWEPSTFDHDGRYFRIYSGRHRDKWTACSTCHTNTSNYAEFSCLNCHEHSQQEAEAEHREVNGYSYASPACYYCHRNV